MRRAAVDGPHHCRGSDMSWAAVLLAAALLIGTDARPRVRAGLVAVEPARRSATRRASDPLAAASSFDVLAACLRSGMPVSTAASATASSAPAALARVLNRAADLLALGAEPATAWTNPAGRADDAADAMLRLAPRSPASGAALAQGGAGLADPTRPAAADAAAPAPPAAPGVVAGAGPQRGGE